MFKFGKRSLERMEGVNPLLVECASMALSFSSHDMTIPPYGGKRSGQDQHKIFMNGNSQKDGYDKKSYHQSGNALDVIPVEGGYRNDKGFRHFARCMFKAWQILQMEGKVEKGLFLEYGGHWQNFIDSPHWQIVKREYKYPVPETE